MVGQRLWAQFGGFSALARCPIYTGSKTKDGGLRF